MLAMTKTKKRLFISACFFCILALPLVAAQGYATPDSSTIGILTGPKTGTYFIFGRDIADAAGKAGITVDSKTSEGSIDNIKRINSNENATLGIVQSDVLSFLGRSKNPDSIRMASNLRMVFPFYNEEVHVLAQNTIKDFKDLQGKRVAIGEDGSGNMLTSVNLFSIMNVKPAKIIKIPSAQGIVAVLKGDVDAAIFVGGKPVRLFKNLEDLTLPENQKYAVMLEKVHFLPMTAPKMLEEYKPAQITHADYNFVKEDVTTIAVPSILISYNFADGANQKRCEQLATLANSIRASLAKLKETGHPKWKEVDLDAKVGNWKKDGCVWVGATAKPEPKKK